MKNKECTFNKNGSCLYYYVIKSVLSNSVTKLEKYLKSHNNNTIKEIIADLKGLSDLP